MLRFAPKMRNMANKIIEHLGGFDSYNGMHLRLEGDSAFWLGEAAGLVRGFMFSCPGSTDARFLLLPGIHPTVSCTAAAMPSTEQQAAQHSRSSCSACAHVTAPHHQ
jgi:hypothetical protein